MSSFKALYYYHLLLAPPDIKWRNREKRDDKQHHEKVSVFIYLSFRMIVFVLFLKKRPLHFLCRLLCYLLMQENVQTNTKGKTLRSSRLQMFFKIAVLKNFAVLSRKHLCRSLVLIKFHAFRSAFVLKKRLQHKRFPASIAKFLRRGFLQTTSGNYIKKEAFAQVFSYKFCEIFRNNFFRKHKQQLSF